MVEKLPGALIITGKPGLYRVLCYYTLLLIGLGIIQVLNKRKMVLCIICSMVCLLVLIFPLPKQSEMVFLDVGQGDAIYLCDDAGTTYFIDGGSTDVDKIGEYRIEPFLKAKGVHKIDYWFVTHVDTDHVSGLIELIESGYKIEHLIVAKAAPKDENLAYLLEIAREKDIEILSMKKGESLITKGIKIHCLYPKSKVGTDRNDASLVLEIDFKTKDKENTFRGS